MKPRPFSAAAQQRARLILQVQSGQLTATAAARQLQLSRKGYYQWEQRALRAMLAAVEQQPPGRPRQRRDPEKTRLTQQVRQLEDQVEHLQQVARLRQQLLQIKAPKLAAKKKRSSCKPFSRTSPPPKPPLA